jgi:hypothetical protein
MPTFNQWCHEKGTVEGIYNWSVPLFTRAEINESLSNMRATLGQPDASLVIVGEFNTDLSSTEIQFLGADNRGQVLLIPTTQPLASFISQARILIAVPRTEVMEDDVWLYAGDADSWQIIPEHMTTTPSAYHASFSSALGQAWQGISSTMNTANVATEFWVAILHRKAGNVYIDSHCAKLLSLLPNRLHAVDSFDIAWANRQLNILDLGYYNYNSGNVLPYTAPNSQGIEVDVGESPTIIIGDTGAIIGGIPTAVDWTPWYAGALLGAIGKTVVRGVKYRRWYYPHHTAATLISQNIEAYDFSIEHQVAANITVQDLHNDATIFTDNGTVALRALVPVLASTAPLPSTQLLAYHMAIDIHKYDERTGVEKLVYTQYLNCPILKHYSDSVAPIANPPTEPTLVPTTGGTLDTNEIYKYSYSVLTDLGETCSTRPEVSCTTGPTTPSIVVTFPTIADPAIEGYGYRLYRWHDNVWYKKTTLLPQSYTQYVTFTDSSMSADWVGSGTTDPRPTTNTTGSVSGETFYRIPIFSGDESKTAFIDDCSQYGIRGLYNSGSIYTTISTITNDGTEPGSWAKEWDTGISNSLLHNTFLNLGVNPSGTYHFKVRGHAKVIAKSSMIDFVPVCNTWGAWGGGYSISDGLYDNIHQLITNVGANLSADTRASLTTLGDGSVAAPVSSLAGYIGLTFDGTTYHGTTIQTADLDTLVEYDFEVRNLSAYSLTISTSHTVGPNPTISWHWNDLSITPEIAFYKVRVLKDGTQIDIGSLGNVLYTRETFFVLPTTGSTTSTYTIEVTAIPKDVDIPVATDSLIFDLDPNVALTDPIIFIGATLTATKTLARYQPIILKLYTAAIDIKPLTPWVDKPAYVGVDKTNWATQTTPALDAFDGEVQFYYKDGKIYTNVDIKSLVTHAVLQYSRLYDYVAVEVDLTKTAAVAPRLYEYHLACLPETPDLEVLTNESIAVTTAPQVQIPTGRTNLRINQNEI